MLPVCYSELGTVVKVGFFKKIFVKKLVRVEDNRKVNPLRYVTR